MKRIERCTGCRNNFYNGRDNFDGKKVCWSLKDARVVLKKMVSVHQVPPWNQKPIKVLSCYHQTGFVYVEGDRKC